MVEGAGGAAVGDAGVCVKQQHPCGSWLPGPCPLDEARKSWLIVIKSVAGASSEGRKE